MQQLASRQPDQQPNGGAPRSQVILVIALVLFSIAGLASGFSVGALTGKTSKTAAVATQTTNTMPPIKGQSAVPTAKPTAHIITSLGCPKTAANTSPMFQQQDGTTIYTFEVQAINQLDKNNCNSGAAIHSTGITFKLWITKHVPNNKKILFTTDTLMHPEHFANPLDGKVGDKDYPELQNELQFSTAQVQQSNNQGQVTWHYTINPNLKNGTYSLVFLDDWQGKVYNWSWEDLVVKK